MPPPADSAARPARHARLFELLRQQEQAHAAAARLGAHRHIGLETVQHLARLNAQSLVDGARARD
ncbi:hypothetical protein ABIE58_001616 [Roseovarius sp. MBR-78]|uniref:hypothetical protein n=1 Tax=Roseovarius sp. MBR-78 TaxID=3156460 RepID=UPI00339B5F73